MRITSGNFSGRTLISPPNNKIRPTSDKVRLAIFNMLISRDLLLNSHVIDGFCGTGALGIEALSNNAKKVTFIDNDIKSIALTKENINNISIIDKCHFLKHDLSKPLKNHDNETIADLVFLDPPYLKNLVIDATANLINNSWIDENTTIVAETEKDANLSAIYDNPLVEKIYKNTKITIFRTNLKKHNNQN